MNLKRILYTVSGLTTMCFIFTWCLFNIRWDLQNAFSAYGTFIAGTVGVGLSAANVFFLLYIWDKQKKEYERQKNEYERRNIEDRFFHLLTMRKDMRSEIRAYSQHDNSNDKQYYPERGNDAINKLAGSFADYQKNYPSNEWQKNLGRLYYQSSEYLRHYYDFILYILEYIDCQTLLTPKQKLEYIRVLTTDSSYNELLIWKLMDYDYADNVAIKQGEILKRFENKYNLFAGRVSAV